MTVLSQCYCYVFLFYWAMNMKLATR